MDLGSLSWSLTISWPYNNTQHTTTGVVPTKLTRISSYLLCPLNEPTEVYQSSPQFSISFLEASFYFKMLFFKPSMANQNIHILKREFAISTYLISWFYDRRSQAGFCRIYAKSWVCELRSLRLGKPPLRCGPKHATRMTCGKLRGSCLILNWVCATIASPHQKVCNALPSEKFKWQNFSWFRNPTGHPEHCPIALSRQCVL